MRILFGLRNLEVGGDTTFLRCAALGLSARGHTVEVAARNGALKTRLQAAGVRVHLLPPTPFSGEGSAREAVGVRAKSPNEKLGREAVKAPGRGTDPFEAMAGAVAVMGTSYAAPEALFFAIPVVAAGYEGYGVVDENNLDDAVACNFGDGFPGVQPQVTSEWLMPFFEHILTHFATDAGREELERMRIQLEANHSLAAVVARLEGIYQRAQEAKKTGDLW